MIYLDIETSSSQLLQNLFIQTTFSSKHVNLLSSIRITKLLFSIMHQIRDSPNIPKSDIYIDLAPSSNM